MGRVRADAVVLQERLGVPVVGDHERNAARPLDRLDHAAEAVVGRLHRLDDRRDHAGVADHVRVREVDDDEAVAVSSIARTNRSATSAADISGLWS